MFRTAMWNLAGNSMKIGNEKGNGHYQIMMFQERKSMVPCKTKGVI